jgi:hypothetical protein
MTDRHARDDDYAPEAIELTREGRLRRDAMLDQLLGARSEVHRRRRSRRRAMLAAAPVLIAGVSAATLVWHWSGGRAAAPIGPGPGDQQPPANIIVMSDQDLLQELAALDRPAGLVRAGGKVWLTQPVTDDALSERGSS